MFQEGMNASSEETFMQELFGQVKARRIVLEEIISYLSKIEEVLKEEKKWMKGTRLNMDKVS